MDTNRYKTFLKVVECGSFSRAAELLHYSQSGISRLIAELESEMGVKLLERGRAGVRLTSDGQTLMPRLKSIADEFDKLRDSVDELNGLKSGILRIGVFSSVATHRLPKLIKRFKVDFPGVDYELLLGDYAEIEEWIESGRVDCGFLRLPTRPEFDTVFLEQDRLMAIVPEGHRLAGYDKIPVREMCGEPFMLLEKGAKTEISEIFERSGLKPQVKFTTLDDYAVMSMVESGLGISILPELILQRIPYKIVAKELDPPSFRSIGFAVRDKKSMPLAMKKFAGYLREFYD